MSGVISSRRKLFGLLELDAAGTILYSNLDRDDDDAGEATTDVTGYNFFSDVAPFANVEELHRRLDSFKVGSEQAKSFVFDCDYEDGTVPVRILLARARERSEDHTTKSLLLHIKRAV